MVVNGQFGEVVKKTGFPWSSDWEVPACLPPPPLLTVNHCPPRQAIRPTFPPPLTLHLEHPSGVCGCRRSDRGCPPLCHRHTHRGGDGGSHRAPPGAPSTQTSFPPCRTTPFSLLPRYAPLLRGEAPFSPRIVTLASPLSSADKVGHQLLRQPLWRRRWLVIPRQAPGWSVCRQRRQGRAGPEHSHPYRLEARQGLWYVIALPFAKDDHGLWSRPLVLTQSHHPLLAIILLRHVCADRAPPLLSPLQPRLATSRWARRASCDAATIHSGSLRSRGSSHPRSWS